MDEVIKTEIKMAAFLKKIITDIIMTTEKDKITIEIVIFAVFVRKK